MVPAGPRLLCCTQGPGTCFPTFGLERKSTWIGVERYIAPSFRRAAMNLHCARLNCARSMAVAGTPGAQPHAPRPARIARRSKTMGCARDKETGHAAAGGGRGLGRLLQSHRLDAFEVVLTVGQVEWEVMEWKVRECGRFDTRSREEEQLCWTWGGGGDGSGVYYMAYTTCCMSESRC